MSAIAINSKYVSIPGLKNNIFLQTGHIGEFKIVSLEKSLPINEGNNLILIKPLQDDLIFTNTAIIKKIGRTEIVKGEPIGNKKVTYKNKDKYNHYFDFEVNDILETNNKLSELEYSLPIINNYSNPEKHFQQQYRALPENDYKTIVNGWVYATRTVFGKLINSLPRHNKLEFMIAAMNHFITIDFNNKSILEGLDFLYNYIDRRIMSRGQLLVAIDRIIRKELKDHLPADEVGFIDPETNEIFNISSQAKVFDQLIKMEEQKSLKLSLQDMLNKNERIESRFQQIFSRRSWPVDLEK